MSWNQENTPASGFQAVLQLYFPPESHESESPLHSYIANASQQIPDRLEQLRAKGVLKEEINRKLTKYELSPLHVCAMTKNYQAARLFLENKASLNCQDAQGCTPLHLSAMILDDAMLEIFHSEAEKIDASILDIQNLNHATASMIGQSLRLPNYSPQKIVCYYKKGKGPLQPLNAEQFRDVTKSIYFPYILATPEHLMENWRNLKEASTDAPLADFQSYFSAALEEFNVNPPKLYLEEEFSADGSFSLGLGLKAAEKIPKGKIVALYGGELDPPLPISIYKMGKIEPVRYGNEASRANDSFPNCTTGGLWINGLDQPVFIAAEDIPAGKSIYIDYGIIHQSKWSHYSLFRLKTLEKFYRNLNLKQEYAKYLEMFRTGNYRFIDTYLEFRYIQAKIKYLLNTPSALAYVFFKEILPYEVGEALLTYEVQFFLNWKADNNKAKFLIEFLRIIITIIKYSKLIVNKALSKEIFNYFARLVLKHSVIVAVQEIFLIEADIEKLLSDRQVWKAHKKKMEQSIKIKEEILDAAVELHLPEKAQTAEQKMKDILHINSKNLNVNFKFQLEYMCMLALGRQRAKKAVKIIEENL